MTLNTRNHFIFAFAVFSSIMVGLFIIGLVFTFFTTPIDTIPAVRYESNISFSGILFANHSIFALLNIVILIIYVPVLSFVIYFGFEKTQAPELFYYLIFLLGCLTNIFCLLIPIYKLWTGYSSILLFAGKANFFGEIITVLSFLALGVYTSEEKNHDTDKNMTILIMVSLIFSVIVPINNKDIQYALRVPFGYDNIVNFIRVIAIILTTFTLCLTGYKKDSKDLIFIAVGFLCTSMGYFLLLKTANLFWSITGLILLTVGTILFLKRLHKYYMWK
jgi:hypothetical protein